jgi:hypothetical protein
LGASREHVGNKGKMKKNSSPTTHKPQNLKGKKNQGTLSACSAFPLAARKLYFQILLVSSMKLSVEDV